MTEEQRKQAWLAAVNAQLRAQLGTSQSRFAAASSDPRLSTVGMVMPPGQPQLVANAQGSNVLPTLLGWAAGTYLPQTDLYKQIAGNPWAQGAGLLYMLSQGRYPTINKDWSW